MKHMYHNAQGQYTTLPPYISVVGAIIITTAIILSILTLGARNDAALASYSECIDTHTTRDSFPGTLEEAWTVYRSVCTK